MKFEIESSARFLILFTNQIFYDMKDNLANFRLYYFRKVHVLLILLTKQTKLFL